MHSDTSQTFDDPVPHSRPTLGAEEAEAVSRVIRSGLVAQGREVRRFEESLARFAGAGGAVAVSSGSTGLFLALAALGAGPGREVVIPSYVCSALFHAVSRAGAEAVLAEIDPATGNLEPAEVEKKVTERTAAVIVPHLFGLPADLDRICGLGIPVIEDWAQAVGARAPASRGIISVYSFYATKVMATGEGGMLASDSEEILARVRDLRDYDEKPDLRPRQNAKMTDMAAAMGLVQLARLPDFIARRQEVAHRYDEAFAGTGVSLPPARAGRIYFRYVLGLSGDAEPAMHRAREKGICCARPIFRPLHSYLGLSGFEATEALWRRSLSIPIYPTLTRAEQDRVIEAVLQAAR